jgi:class 3 adenylate cyclase
LGINKKEAGVNGNIIPILDNKRDPADHLSVYPSVAKYDTRSMDVFKRIGDRYDCFLRSLVGKKIKATVVCIDIINSCERVRNLSTESAGEYYEAFIENMSNVVEKYGGYVLKSVGDCVIGLFPCSKYMVENHDRAVSCGLAMRDVVKGSLNQYLIGKKLPSIDCRISADLGEAKVIEVSSAGGYSAVDLFGNVMNSTSKISHYAKSNQMVVGENLLYELVDSDVFVFKLINHFSLSRNNKYPVYLVERSLDSGKY